MITIEQTQACARAQQVLEELETKTAAVYSVLDELLTKSYNLPEELEQIAPGGKRDLQELLRTLFWRVSGAYGGVLRVRQQLQR